ncbi:hypothetical protein ACOI1C_22570 [Bacillus sp. DJP31]|uniref:hypothetical protein n=1 Tax=Bacillus sp. DJP31 TaxID=3409789 RepID=UPI003BB52FF7
MELGLPKKSNKFFWFLFLLIMVFISIHNMFYYLELQNYGFNELEDFGRLIFALCVSACESILIAVFLWWIINIFKKNIRNQRS